MLAPRRDGPGQKPVGAEGGFAAHPGIAGCFFALEASSVAQRRSRLGTMQSARKENVVLAGLHLMYDAMHLMHDATIGTPAMRTTLVIDDDVLSAARELAAIKKKTVGEVISSLARQALSPGKSKVKTRNGVPLLEVRKGAARVTSELVRRLREELP